MKIKDLATHFDKNRFEYWTHNSVHYVPDLPAPKESIENVAWPTGTYFDRVQKPVMLRGKICFPNKKITKVTFEVTTPEKEPSQTWICFRFTTDEEIAMAFDIKRWTEVYYCNGRLSYGAISKNYKL